MEMRRHKVTYKGLTERLGVLGIRISVNTLIQKINRMEFSAHFFIACMVALEVETLEIGDFEVRREVLRTRRLAQSKK